MSLRVWLPLNGDIKNYGTDIVETATLGGAGFTNSGKTGKALNNASDNCGVNLKTYMNTASTFTKYSMCAWVYMSQQATNHSSSIMSSGNWNSSASQCCFGFYSYSDGYNKILVPNKSSFTGSVVLSTPITLNKWWHVCITYDGSTTKAYVNGSYVGSYSGGGITGTSETSNLYVGRATYYNGFTLRGKICDVRIYDNCLTANEVKDISKALVLYYPLSDQMLEPTTNLITSFDTSFQSYALGTRNLFTDQSGGTQSIALDPSGRKCFKFHCGENSAASSQRCYFTVSTQASKTYTISADMLSDSSTSSRPVLHMERYGGDYSWSGSEKVYSSSKVGEWQRLSITFTNTSDTTLYVFFYQSAGKDVYIRNVQLEEKNHATPYVKTSRTGLTVYDCSGYNRNGTVTASTCPTVVSGSARNNYCCQFDGTDDYIVAPVKQTDILSDKKFTISTWVYSTELKNYRGALGRVKAVDGKMTGIAFCHENVEENVMKFFFYDENGSQIQVKDSNYSLNTWLNYVMVYDGTKEIIYRNGIKVGEASGSIVFADDYINIGRFREEAERYWKGKISDVKIYATALSAADVAEEYRVFAAIYQDKTFYSSDIIETPCANLLEKTNANIIKKTFSNALSRYTQTNCSVTLTSDGCRIYRPANKTVSGDGNTMWGGLVLKPYNENNSDILFKGHTYILKWHVKGKSSNAGTDSGWSNNVGWGGGGLMPSPSNTSAKWTPSNFNGEMDCWYKWTINDDVYKVCTSSYSSFVQGNTYLSYRDFKFGFGYTDTGSLGTDLYITNIRLYDITANKKVNIGLNSVLSGELVEGNYDKVSMFSDGEIYSREFINI